MTHYAHSGNEPDRSDWQSLPDHLEAVERLARARGALLGLGEAAALAGCFHDLGKYDPAFDRVLCGDQVRIGSATAFVRLRTFGREPQSRVCGFRAGL